MKQDNNALHAARATIDRVDAQMAQLFCERMAAAAAVAEYKKQVGLPVFDREREAQVLAAGAARIEDEGGEPDKGGDQRERVALGREREGDDRAQQRDDSRSRAKLHCMLARAALHIGRQESQGGPSFLSYAAKMYRTELICRKSDGNCSSSDHGYICCRDWLEPLLSMWN